MLMATQSPTVVLTLTIILGVLDAFVVSLRFYARSQRKQRLLIDDWLTIPAMALNVGLATTLIHGTARHVYGYATPVPPTQAAASRLLERTSWTELGDNITIAEKDEWIFLLISIPALGCIKLSILFFYQRLFVMSKRDWRDPRNIAIWLMITIVTMWTLAFFLRYLFACGFHFDIWWTNAMNIITLCGDFNTILNALAISDFVCDVIILILPLPAIWKLRLPTAQKFTVTLVFALGGFSTIASMIQNFNPELDVDLLITTFLFWNYLEATTALLAACLPTLRGLFRTSSLDSAIQSLRSRIGLNSKSPLNSSIRKKEQDEAYVLRSLDSERGLAADTPSGT
ncbi:uncharacterized protein CC84DRAFT_1262345 [Paraphaeosphaeria sporulosa]|uniref:Rhodopsin domain-containing protein n=1 Tax=Paraphaeosphaeria sporulosa TaxID=1460663 RepID=A0A177C456_9PLEO|nr:uncharacterized protein CC84DRAFT_1262345 [Paraphaeosphaeria sporulosa]OAG02413.1 hypothetical protein CC84DRAFT_1262345 [Paraphaeosphaeria sporulosa]